MVFAMMITVFDDNLILQFGIWAVWWWSWFMKGMWREYSVTRVVHVEHGGFCWRCSLETSLLVGNEKTCFNDTLTHTLSYPFKNNDISRKDLWNE